MTAGQVAYEAYGESRGWKTATGGSMPKWIEQRPELCEAWERASAAAIQSHIDRTSRIRVWQLSDEDSVAAETRDEAIAWYLKEYDFQPADIDQEADEIPMDHLFYTDESRSAQVTVARAIAECTQFPCVLFSTEY